MGFCLLVCLVASAAALRAPLDGLDAQATEQLLRDWNLHDFFGKEVTNIQSDTFVTRMLTCTVLDSSAS